MGIFIVLAVTIVAAAIGSNHAHRINNRIHYLEHDLLESIKDLHERLGDQVAKNLELQLENERLAKVIRDTYPKTEPIVEL